MSEDIILADEPIKEVRFIDPYTNLEEDYSWLELDRIPEHVPNPFFDRTFDQENLDPAQELVSIMKNPDYLHFACRHLLNLELLPFQLVTLDVLWKYRMPMLIGTRGFSKSFIIAVYCLLKLVFHPNCRIVICGAAFRQSKIVFEYMSNIWDKAPILRDISGGHKLVGPRRDIDQCLFTIGDSTCTALPLGDGTKIRGKRANIIIGEEFSSIPEEIFNLVVQGFGVVSSAPIEKVKEAAMVRKLKKMGQWTEEMNNLRISQATGNQIIYSGTAYYSFNHFARTHEKFHKIIVSKGTDNSVFDGEAPPDGFNYKDYAILRVPYTHIPEGMLDAGIIATAKANLSTAQFNMEFNAIFSGDSDGFFKRSTIEAATTNRPITTSTGKRIQYSAMKHGEKEKVYVMGVDPAAMEDNAAIVLIEMNTDHRKIVNCWTTNRKKFQNLKREMAKQGLSLQNDYYGYIARKIREFMSLFNIERIVMDKNGGGIAVAEALKIVNPGEHCIYEIIDPENPKHDDGERGLHILELLAPTSQYNSDANHGMLKDLQDRVLMFPRFDTIEIEKAIIQDKVNGTTYDTYEELCEEIEQLKNEMTIINVTESSALGKEVYDVPKVKSAGMEKGHLRKDRYSALLYANYYARTKDKQELFRVDYVPVGGTKGELIAHSANQAGQMYVGPGTLKFAGKGHYNGPAGYNVVRH